MSILWDNIFNFNKISTIRISYFNSKYAKIPLTNQYKHVIMWLGKLKTMCLVGQFLQSNSVKKQVITRLSGYVMKRSFIY